MEVLDISSCKVITTEVCSFSNKSVYQLIKHLRFFLFFLSHHVFVLMARRTMYLVVKPASLISRTCSLYFNGSNDKRGSESTVILWKKATLNLTLLWTQIFGILKITLFKYLRSTVSVASSYLRPLIWSNQYNNFSTSRLANIQGLKCSGRQISLKEFDKYPWKIKHHLLSANVFNF